MSSVRDCFSEALRILVGPGLAKERLAAAWRVHLDDISLDELPARFRDEFGQLKNALHAARPCGGLGVIEASVRKMSEQQAGTYAARIARIFEDLPEGPQRSAPAFASFPFRVAVGEE